MGTQQKKIITIEVVIVILLGLFLGSASLIFPFGLDHGEHASIADAFLKGEVVYKDVFNVKPPVTYLLYACAIKLFGHSMIAIRLFNMLWQCLTAVALLFFARSFYRMKFIGSGASLLYLLAYYSFNYVNSAETDSFIALPLVLCLISFVAATRGSGVVWYGVAGLLLSVAVLLKYPIGILIVFLAIIVLFSQGRPKRGEIKNTLVLIGGFSLGIFVCVISLVRNGSLAAFLDTGCNYVSQYSLDFSSKLLHMAAIVQNLYSFWVSQPLFIVLSLVVVGEVWYLAKKKSSLGVYLVVFCWVSALVHLVFLNKYFKHHLLPILVPQALITAHVMWRIFAGVFKRIPRMKFFAAVLGVCFLVMIYVRTGYRVGHKALMSVCSGKQNLESIYAHPFFGVGGKQGRSMRSVLALSAYLHTHSNGDDQVFVWGFEPSVYFLSERACASRFIFNLPLYGQYQRTRQFRREFMEEMRRNRPRFIIIVKNDAFPMVTNTLDDSLEAFMKFTEFHDFVMEYYNQETVIDNFIVFHYNGGVEEKQTMVER